MTLNVVKKDRLLIAGEGKLAYSVSVCLLLAGYPVTLCTENKKDAVENINIHFADLSVKSLQQVNRPLLEITDTLDSRLPYRLVIVVTEEDPVKKRTLIQKLERRLPLSSIIAVNSESISLSALQEDCKCPARIMGMNWSEPAHTTYFLEIISNHKTKREWVDDVYREAKMYWNKDPYIVSDDLGIRAKMMAAMTREAFYLVENGFASMEDIDRAGRNDPGYYLPFAGNFRYIDLMGGAFAFSRVMNTLNPELSKATEIPEFFTDFIQEGAQSMDNNKGIYEYKPGEAEKWKEGFRKYSYEIQEIIQKYPFNYDREHSSE